MVGRLLDTLSMMKRGETLRDTPQAVTIMTSQRIEEQKLVTISEVLTQAPGVTVENEFFGRPNSYYSRGFAITNMQVDGTSIDVGRSYYFNPNLAAYEQVEVLRGADGLFAGNGDPGGTVNLSRKRALANPQLLVGVSASRWDSFRTQVDVSSPLALDGRVRGRFVANLYDKAFYHDTAKGQGSFFYGTVEADLGDRPVVIAGASKEKSDQLPWQGGLPRYATGEGLALSRSTALVADWSTWNSSAKEYFLRLEHAFGERWMLAASATRGESSVHTISGAAYGYDANFNAGVAPGETVGRAMGSGYNYDSKRTNYDVSAQGKFDLFGREHSVLLGVDVQRLDNISAPGAALGWCDVRPDGRHLRLRSRLDPVPDPGLHLGDRQQHDPPGRRVRQAAAAGHRTAARHRWWPLFQLRLLSPVAHVQRRRRAALVPCAISLSDLLAPVPPVAPAA